jgi:hypothetical protein
MKLLSEHEKNFLKEFSKVPISPIPRLKAIVRNKVGKHICPSLQIKFKHWYNNRTHSKILKELGEWIGFWIRNFEHKTYDLIPSHKVIVGRYGLLEKAGE